LKKGLTAAARGDIIRKRNARMLELADRHV
jgi:hypothetical protein